MPPISALDCVELAWVSEIRASLIGCWLRTNLCREARVDLASQLRDRDKGHVPQAGVDFVVQ